MLTRDPIRSRLLITGAMLIVATSSGTAVAVTDAGHRSTAQSTKESARAALSNIGTALADSQGGKMSSIASRPGTIRSLLRQGKPAEALGEYDRLAAEVGKDDEVLLREIAIAFILPMRQDMREQMRGAAYTALIEVHSEEMVPYLEGGLSDGSGMVRALAAEGLGKLKGGRRSEKFRHAVSDPAALVRMAVLRGLARSQDPKAIPLVRPSLDDEQGMVRVAAAGALVALGERAHWSRLEQAVAAGDRWERRIAVRWMGELNDRRGVPILLEALEKQPPSIRAAAAAGLGELKFRQAAPALRKGLADPIAGVRAACAVSLGKLGAKDSKSVLLKSLQDADPGVRAATVSALLQLGASYGEVAETLRGLLHDQNPGARSAAAKALSQGRGQAVVDVLSQLLSDPVPRPRIASVRSLGRVGGREVIPLLKAALRDRDAAVQATAGGALGRVLSRPDGAPSRASNPGSQLIPALPTWSVWTTRGHWVHDFTSRPSTTA